MVTLQQGHRRCSRAGAERPAIFRAARREDEDAARPALAYAARTALRRRGDVVRHRLERRPDTRSRPPGVAIVSPPLIRPTPSSTLTDILVR